MVGLKLSVFSIKSGCVSSGGWEGQASFKMSFPSGGAIEVGQHLFKLATNGWYNTYLMFYNT